MNKIHNIKNIHFNDKEMIITIDDKEYKFSIEKISAKLLKATPEERMNYEISPSGYGINWSLIDEDLSIDSLLGITHKPKIKSASGKI